MIEQLRYSVVGTLILAVFCGMMLSGCGDLGDFLGDILRINDDAEAQDETRIEIFTIGAGSFLLRSDTRPTIEVSDGFTKYTLIDDGTLTYAQGQTISLDPDDEVIERPDSSTVTVITRN
ncbi:MAG: hypothetical protein OEU26_15355 [Candidatus Tectomicrobia bacterium]|nr:hypothetical protein [Candidatus Tectomicrobia bacterium]